MSDADLLVFGCAVSFIAAAGAYVYFREAFRAQGLPARRKTRRVVPIEMRLREMARAALG